MAVLNLKQFLSSGTTHVHTKSPGGLFPKVAGVIVMALCAGAATIAISSQAGQPGAQLAELDSFSQFQQDLASPSGKVKIISTNSPNLLAYIQSIPAGDYQRVAKLANATQSADTVSPEQLAQFLKTAHKPTAGKAYVAGAAPSLLGTPQVYCFANTYDNLDQVTKRAGVQNIEFVERAAGLGGVVYQPLHEAKLHVQIHELQHCTSTDFALESNAYHMMGDAGRAYANAYSEMLADLAVVLYMAGQDGSFDNGLAMTRATRGVAFVDIEHNTEDMLEHVLSQLDARDFAGKSVDEIYTEVNNLSSQLDPLNNSELRNLFVHSAAEKMVVGYRAFQNFGGSKENERYFLDADMLVEDLQQHVATGPLSIDADRRAQTILKDMVTNNLRNPELHRVLGVQTQDSFKVMAKQMGVELDSKQLNRIAVFDPAVSAPGSGSVSPYAQDKGLSSKDHHSFLLSSLPAMTISNSPAPSAPRMR